MASAAAALANLHKFQCLFEWKNLFPHFYDRGNVITSVKDKILTSDCEWRAIVYNVVLAYEYFHMGDDDCALECLRECENILQAAECFGVGLLVVRTMESVKHVVHAMWANCVARNHTEDEYKDYLQNVKKFSSLNNKEKAGVRGMQAACLMQYGLSGVEQAHEIIQTAIKFDPHEPEWYFLLGEVLRILRCSRDNNESVPHPLEISFLQKACDLGKESPAYQLALAYALHDSVRKSKGSCPTRDRASTLYKTALQKWPNSAYVNLMAASGLLEYAYPVRDTKLADKCLEKALNLAPDSCHVHLVVGVYFYWPCKNIAVGMGHLNKAKKRFSKIVEEILEGNITNYREALSRGLWETSDIITPVVAF